MTFFFTKKAIHSTEFYILVMFFKTIKASDVIKIVASQIKTT